MFSVGDSTAGAAAHSSSSTGRHSRLRNWIVPRRTMCILFWTGVMLIFTGMILLVTSQHKGKAFQSWGAVLLGLGLCVMLGCLILCLHTYFVMSRIDRGDDDVELTDEKIYQQRREAMYPSTTKTPNTTSTTTTTAAKTPNANMSMTSSTAVTIDMINGRNSTGFNRFNSQFVPTPRCGISVVTTPPPTVKLYVSDVIDQGAPTDGAKSLEPEVTSTPSTDPLSSGDTTSPPTAGSTDIAACVVENGSRSRRSGYDVSNGSRVRSPTSPPPNDQSRKLSTSGNVTSQPTIAIKVPPEPDEGDAWLAQWRQERGGQPQHLQRPTSLPFPPAHITFNAIDHDDDVTAEAAAVGGLSSCDSFNQSTETIIARDPTAAKNSKASAAARRKSVYYNAAETLPNPSADSETEVFLSLGHKSKTKPHGRTNTPSGGGTEGDQKYRRHRTHRHERHRRESDEPASLTVPRRSAASALVSERDVTSGCRRSLQWTGQPAEDEPAGRTLPPSYLSVTTVPVPPVPNPAACRVTRVSLHSDVVRRQHQLPVPGPDDNRPPSAAAAATTTTVGRGAGALPVVRFAGPDTVQLTRPHRPPPTSAAATATTSGLSAGVSGPSRGRLAAAGGATTSTSRTFGPACVTITPLGPVDECARFPTGRELRDHRPSQQQQPLDPADLLREEYEASFGGEVNPLLLYSGGSLDNQEVTLSKQTVYDNVQYFNV